MSTLRVNSITNVGSTVDFPTDILQGTGRVTREVYEQTSQPTDANDGALWWNTSTSTLKMLIEGEWYPVGTIEPSPPMLGDRGLFITSVIDYVSIPTAGNATDFGDSSVGGSGAVSNGSRAVFGYGPLEYVTIATAGNGVTFGDLTVSRGSLVGASGATRGLFAGGLNYPTEYNTIDYITVATTGNAVDFGDLTNTPFDMAACSSVTYSVFAGGATDSNVGASTNVIQYVTTDTAGNAIDFGDLTVARYRPAGFSDGGIGVFAGGGSNANFNSALNVIDYITIGTPSNATDFGDLATARNYTGGTANQTRGVVGGGYSTSMSLLSSIEYVTIATPSNATTFGNLTVARASLSGCSGN